MTNLPAGNITALKIPLVFFLILCGTGAFIPAFSQNGPALFEIEERYMPEWRAKIPAELESHSIRINENTLRKIRQNEIDRFLITDHQENEYEVEVRRLLNHDEENWSVTGTIGGEWKNRFTLSFSENKVLSGMKIITEHKFYQIKYEELFENHILLKMDPHQTDELECGADHDEVHGGLIMEMEMQKKVPQLQAEETATIDVMIVYTPQARQWANQNSGGIHNVINEAMAIAQHSADNSGLDIRFRLVHRELVDYEEDGRSHIDLQRLTASDSYNPWGGDYASYLQEVHVMRDEYGADLVAMFTYTNDVGGLAWLLNNANGRPELGFSVTRIQQAGWTSTHAHEMGHNFGNEHSRNQQSNAAGESGGLFEYSTGWRWTGQDGTGYASVMTYREGDQAVDVFSNPDVFHQGVPAGSYSGQYSPADNARSMSEVKHTIASYRESAVYTNPPTVVTGNVSAISFTSAQAGGEVTDDGGSFAEERGVCYSEFPNPGLSDLCIRSGSGTGAFTAEMSGLDEGTTYFVRAFATNWTGTSFGNEQSFTTLSRNVPVVVTQPARNITVSSAIAGGDITDDGGGEITEKGVCWSRDTQPGLNDYCKRTDEENSEFEIEITELKHSTTYYIRGFAANESGTSFGQEEVFRTETLRPPGLLEASEVTAVSFNANWQDVPSAERYKLDVARDADFTSLLSGYENRDVGETLSENIGGLYPGQDYYYRLRSVIETGESELSGVEHVQTVNVSAGGSAVSSSLERVLATGVQNSEVIVIVTDRDGEKMEGIEVTIEPDGGSSQVTPVQDITGESGEALFTITNTTEETIHYSVFASGLRLNQQFMVEFLHSDGELLLGNNFPNPFQYQTYIPFALPEASRVRIDIFNASGSRIQTVVDEVVNVGYYEIPFDAGSLSSGVYFYRLITDSKILNEKMLLVR